MLTLENVSVNYGAIEALTGVSMRVEKGEVVTLIGANGAGKTTTLRTITGLLQPRAGKVIFEDEDISGKATHKLVARGISMSPEGRGVFANLSVRENLQMGAYLKKNKRRSRPTWSVRSRCFHDCGNVNRRRLEHSPAASNRCSRWDAR